MRRQFDSDVGIKGVGYYAGLTAGERDELIVKLHRKGFSQAKIAHRLGLTQQAISKALRRIAEGRPGRDPRG
jgi:IS30 family transposase